MLYNAFCRVYQGAFKIGMYTLPWSMPKTIEGAGSIRQLPSLIKEKGFTKVLVVTDGVLMKLGLLDTLFEAMAEIHGTQDRLHKHAISKSDAKQEAAAKSIAMQKRSKFEFAKLGIPVGAELEYIHDRTIKVVVVDDKRHVSYNGEEWTLSALAKVLLNRNSTVQGTLHFSYNGETISDLRDRLEEDN